MTCQTRHAFGFASLLGLEWQAVALRLDATRLALLSRF
jgi:hypothetical protein